VKEKLGRNSEILLLVSGFVLLPFAAWKQIWIKTCDHVAAVHHFHFIDVQFRLIGIHAYFPPAQCAFFYFCGTCFSACMITYAPLDPDGSNHLII